MYATDFQRILDTVHEWWKACFNEVLVHGQLALTDDDRHIAYITQYHMKPGRVPAFAVFVGEFVGENQQRGSLHCHHLVWYSEDHLQLPPVPEWSSMLALLEGTSAEHKV